ncbi:SDR family oxidoreductase [Falsibacillus pallidus]|uniref:SDR family oxidoreductase n=1 Tax=Falsibacillus pallidus TaxID=493781 RepID=UPI003D98CFDD
MKILVTGGTGVLGSRFAALAKREGHQVFVASRNKPSSTEVEWTFLDLETGEGLSRALSGVEAVFHAATSPVKNTDQVDIAGTNLLLEECKKYGVKHFIYPSIVGIDLIPMKYYKAKLAAEELIMNCGIPYTIVRMTQFHNLIDRMISTLAKYPAGVLPTTLKFQPVDVDEAAEVLVGALKNGPSGMEEDFAGPEVMSLKELFTIWKSHKQIKKLMIPLSYFPNKTFKSFQEGKNTNPQATKGAVTWKSWVEKQN